MTTFKDPKMQEQYELFRKLAADPTSEFWYAGKPHRGAGHRAAYWNGRSGLKPIGYARNTVSYLAWAAGRDDLRAFGPVAGSEYHR